VARFRATIKGSRGEVSRLGTEKSGLDVNVNGWTKGVRVVAYVQDGVDTFDVWETDGSASGARVRKLVTIREKGE
jgi:hypothetical protein